MRVRSARPGFRPFLPLQATSDTDDAGSSFDQRSHEPQLDPGKKPPRQAGSRPSPVAATAAAGHRFDHPTAPAPERLRRRNKRLTETEKCRMPEGCSTLQKHTDDYDDKSCHFEFDLSLSPSCFAPSFLTVQQNPEVGLHSTIATRGS